MAKPTDARIKISDIFLDSKNPRHSSIDNEPEIIDHLVKKEKVLALAREIAVHGTSPLERLAVIPHPEIKGKYIVQEGNRRLCSLKLLRDPDRAPTAKTRAAFEQLKLEARLSPSVDVVIFPDRVSARYWLKLRHLGGQGGAGVRNWDATQKTRFDAEDSGTNPNALAVDLLQYAHDSGIISEGDLEKIKVTTLTRYLSNAVVRDALGLADRYKLVSLAKPDQFDIAVSTFLRDAAQEDSPISSRSNRQDREAYAATLRQRGAAVKDKVDRPVVPSVAAAKQRQRNNPNPDFRPKIVPASFKVVLESAVLKRVFDELRQIDPDLSFASAYLFRAFLEQIIHDYAKVNGVGGGEFHFLAGKCEKHLSGNAALRSEFGERKLESMLKPLRTMANDRESRISPDTLGAWVHGSMIPTGAEIKRRWDTLEPAIYLLCRGLKK
ncbi:hypothetical protein FJU31_06500 [Stenotrophomonas cyclobalanopsidis]|uniref:ParB/Sulfiredoxin domain-containing protein n=1 Tax=Stenotrophomonas cyclobalanopsidis TaxID=2771362 RepID=A0ABQ6T2Q1_9GAMM|nr:hypothetical protein [Stenotrophomonas cyclobalanopsidis]KAA9000794.1 hypothetical protein FJU31_06500 [Stenotrophomonas cyclobalanopsidis]